MEIPEYWTRFITSNTLMGKYFEIGETDDESGAGADLKLLTPEQTLDEATNCWPGIGVAPDGYVPVASCLIGTGDYYYINVNDSPGGPLYRIYHEAVGEHGYKAIEQLRTPAGICRALTSHSQRAHTKPGGMSYAVKFYAYIFIANVLAIVIVARWVEPFVSDDSRWAPGPWAKKSLNIWAAWPAGSVFWDVFCSVSV